MIVNSPRRFRGRHFLTLAVVALAIGCRAEEQIQTYTVPKQTVPPAAATASAPAAEMGEPVDRMLTAIVPEGGQAWFYKVVGPIPAVDAQADKILEFVASVPPAGGSAAPPWKLPESWTSKPGTDGFTLATIQIPNDGKPLDLTVSSLAWSGSKDGLLLNVNRWRGQMGLPQPITADKLADDTREMKAGDRTITIVDLRGVFRRSGMPPFARGMTEGVTPGASGPFQPLVAPMPADHPPIGKSDAMPATTGGHDGATLGNSAAAAVPKFEAPAAWEQAPAGGMNRAVFRVASGGQEAAVTVSNIPVASGAMFADPLQNANLWRSGVGLPAITQEELKESSEAIEIGGKPATLVSAIPGEDKPEGTLAAAVTHDDQIWYFKIKGARQLITDRRDEFQAFLKTVRFAE